MLPVSDLVSSDESTPESVLNVVQLLPVTDTGDLIEAATVVVTLLLLLFTLLLLLLLKLLFDDITGPLLLS